MELKVGLDNETWWDSVFDSCQHFMLIFHIKDGKLLHKLMLQPPVRNGCESCFDAQSWKLIIYPSHSVVECIMKTYATYWQFGLLHWLIISVSCVRPVAFRLWTLTKLTRAAFDPQTPNQQPGRSCPKGHSGLTRIARLRLCAVTTYTPTHYVYLSSPIGTIQCTCFCFFLLQFSSVWIILGQLSHTLM